MTGTTPTARGPRRAGKDAGKAGAKAGKRAPGPKRRANFATGSGTAPDDRLERSLCREGVRSVAGLDEVGRGAWAGPVSVGVVLFPDDLEPPPGLRDSKMLTEERREALYPLINEWCSAWSVGHAGPEECDALGMTAALRLAARRALAGLASPPRVILMDGAFDYVTPPVDAADAGGTSPPPSPRVRTVVRGDASCVSIAAASIMAKVTRDRMMRGLSASFPPFDFDRNKGYPSPVHRTALAGFGLTSIHRRSWSFVDDLAFR